MTLPPESRASRCHLALVWFPMVARVDIKLYHSPKRTSFGWEDEATLWNR